ncbi:MAG: McrC family protein [Pleomorphochaeta sp.]
MKKTKIITIFQDRKTNIINYKEFFDEIIQIKQIIGDQNCILETDGNILIRNYVGTFSTKSINLQVLPKIFCDANSDINIEIEESLEFLYRLLSWSTFFKFKSLESCRTISKTNSFLEILINIFINKFLILFIKSNYREYIGIESLEIFLRGKVLFNKTIDYDPSKIIKKNILFDELDINNLINQIIKTTILKLLSFSENLENKKLLRKGLLFLENVQTIKLTQDLFNKISFNRINLDYEPIINFAEMFFNNSEVKLGAGDKSVLAFTFQVNILFEFLIKNLLDNYCIGKNLTVTYQSGGFLATDKNNKKYFPLKPDFRIVSESNDTLVILDTKYKKMVNSEDKLNIKISDMYQMCTYGIRFNCNSLVLIYPKYKGEENKFNDKVLYIKQKKIDFKIHMIQIDIFKTEKELIENELIEKLSLINDRESIVCY